MAAAVKPGPYEEVLKRLRERFDYATDEWRSVRDEGATDVRFVAGNPWDDADRTAREEASRPVLSFDEISQYTNQVVNGVRQYKRAIKVTPIGAGANDKSANFRAELIRQIEYRSNAQQAYTTMFENTVQRSYGFARIKAKYVTEPKASGGDGASFNQELLIDPATNPDLHTPDPDFLKPDLSDCKYWFVHESWSLGDYKKKHPKAKIQDFDATTAKQAPGWLDSSRIRLAEYWEIDEQERTLLLFQTPQGAVEVFADELAKPEFKALKGLSPAKSRSVSVPTVTCYLTNGFEILGEPKAWPGAMLPFIGCLGKVLYLDEGAGSKRTILSLVRLARDPAMMLAYYASTEAEVIGMTPKTPFVGYKGQFRGQEDEWQKASAEPVAYLEANPTTEETGSQVLPLPQRMPYAPPVQQLEIGKESARRAIQAAMGISPMPTAAQRQNEKSGKALERIQQSQAIGSFHFADAYEMAITRVATILNELIPHYYDTARDVTVRSQTDEPKQVRVNDDSQLAEGQEEPVSVGDGLHDVTLSTGPSYDSEREAAADFAESLLQTPAFPLIGDLIVKLRNLGPIGDEIADRLTPPQFKQQKDGQPDPAQLQQQLQQMKQMIEALTKELNAKNQLIETDRIKQQGQVQLEQVKQTGEAAKTKHETEAKLFIARMQVVAELLKVRATLEQKHTEALIDAANAELDRELATDAQRIEQENTTADRETAQAENEASRQHELTLAEQQAASSEASAE